MGTAAALAAAFAVPLGIFLAGMTEITLAFISAAVLFLPLFVFLPKVIQRGMKAEVPDRDRYLREERAGKKGVLDIVRGDGRTGDGTGFRTVTLIRWWGLLRGWGCERHPVHRCGICGYSGSYDPTAHVG